MRLLHTSDWHIGRSLHGTDLLAEQEAVLSGLASVVATESVDVVVVAGDVYDRAVPSADATGVDRKSTRLNSSHANISYAVFCLKKKKYKDLLIRRQ